MRRRAATMWTVLGLLGTLTTFLFSYRFVMHHFLVGPYLWDAGWYAEASFRHGFLMPNLLYLRPALGDSVFTQHLYGLVSLASPVSYLFPTHYGYFAATVGAINALTFVGPFLAVMGLYPRADRSWAVACVAFAAGLAFALSGPVMAAVGYPHYELAIPGLFLVFIALHFLGWSRARWVALALGVLVREDAGLHYAGYFALIALFEWRSGRQVIGKKTLLWCTVLCAGVALAMFVIQRNFFPLGASMFHKSFVGDPPFAQLRPAETWSRISTFVFAARHLYGPTIVVGLAAAAFRAPAYVLAYAACLPWIVLNVVVGLTPASQTLSLYYGFPLLVGLAWPLVAPHWMPIASRSRRPAILTFFVATLLSMMLLRDYAFVRESVIAGGSVPAATFALESDCLQKEFRLNPKLYADTAVVAMFPYSVPQKRILRTREDVAAIDADGLVFYENDMAPAYLARARVAGLVNETSLATPRIRFMSREPSALATCVSHIEGR